MKKSILLYSFLLGATFTRCAHDDDQGPLNGAILQSTGPLPEDRLFTALVNGGASEREAKKQADRYIEDRKELCTASALCSMGSGFLSAYIWPYFMETMKPEAPIFVKIIDRSACGGILCALGCGSACALKEACYEYIRDIEPEDIESALTQIYPQLHDTFKVMRTQNRDQFVLIPIITHFAVERTNLQQFYDIVLNTRRMDRIGLMTEAEYATVPAARVIKRS